MTTTTDSESNNKIDKKQPITFNFAIVNARSLSPKIDSAAELFDELSLSLMIVSETWLRGDAEQDRVVNVLYGGHGVDLLVRNRRSRGGGVGILYKSTALKLKEHRFRKKNYEMLCARGKVVGCSRELYVFAIYVKPSLPAEKKVEMVTLITEELIKIKTTNTNPLICIGGDFNHLNTDAITDVVPGVKKLETPPSRGSAILDLAFCNFPIREVFAGPPLETKTGIRSDHDSIVVESSLESSHNFRWIKYQARKKTEEGKARFKQLFNNIDWVKIMGDTVCPDESVRRLHERIGRLTDMCFPKKSYKIRSTDHPWITDQIRKMIRRRKRQYKRKKRSKKWHEIKIETDAAIKKARRNISTGKSRN